MYPYQKISAGTNLWQCWVISLWVTREKWKCIHFVCIHSKKVKLIKFVRFMFSITKSKHFKRTNFLGCEVPSPALPTSLHFSNCVIVIIIFCLLSGQWRRTDLCWNRLYEGSPSRKAPNPNWRTDRVRFPGFHPYETRCCLKLDHWRVLVESFAS